jgi:hypothetical protein
MKTSKKMQIIYNNEVENGSFKGYKMNNEVLSAIVSQLAKDPRIVDILNITYKNLDTINLILRDMVKQYYKNK